MKKSVVILIGVIYGLSIVLVTLFGLRYQSFNDIVYVSKIEVIEKNASYLSDGSKYVNLPVGEDGTCQYQLVWQITPDNPTNGDVYFNYDTSNPRVTVDENGLVTFTSEGFNDSILITITASDGTGVSDSIRLRFRHSK